MFKRTLFAIATVALAPSCASVTLDPPSHALIERDADLVVDDSQIIVVTPSAHSAMRLRTAAARRGYELYDEQTLEGLNVIMLSFRVAGGVDGAAAIRELEAMAPEVTAGVNHRYTLQSDRALQIATLAGAHSGVKSIARDMLAWPQNGCPARVRVGVIDAAVDERAVGGLSIVKKDFTRGREAKSERGHATAVAEILGGDGRLVGATIYNAAVVSQAGGLGPSAGVDAIMRALDWMSAASVKVVNVSLAGPYNKILDMGFQKAARRGVIVVAAAGNDGAGSPPRYPAGFRDVIAVTAVDVVGDVFEDAVQGEHIDIAAPGVDVFVTLGESDGGSFLSGTSIAAPFVTARLAAEESISDDATPGRARRLLAANAVDLGRPGVDSVYGAGLVKAPAACRPGDQH